jgi:DNA-binding transcriptional ArsR family regulator
MDSPDLTRIAATIGDASRVRMLTLLMEGRALTAKELALGAGIAPATATAHLSRLLNDKLVDATAQGRHKYFRLASEDAAHLMEALMRVAPPRAASSHHAIKVDPIRQARYCYDHLAGGLGTALLATMQRKIWLIADTAAISPKAVAVSAKGERALASLGLDLSEIRTRRRQFACTCLDWSERKDHLGGALGAALALRLTELKWIARKKHSRVVTVTPEGHVQIAKLGVRLAD